MPWEGSMQALRKTFLLILNQTHEMTQPLHMELYRCHSNIQEHIRRVCVCAPKKSIV